MSQHARVRLELESVKVAVDRALTLLENAPTDPYTLDRVFDAAGAAAARATEATHQVARLRTVYAASPHILKL